MTQIFNWADHTAKEAFVTGLKRGKPLARFAHAHDWPRTWTNHNEEKLSSRCKKRLS